MAVKEVIELSMSEEWVSERSGWDDIQCGFREYVQNGRDRDIKQAKRLAEWESLHGYKVQANSEYGYEVYSDIPEKPLVGTFWVAYEPKAQRLHFRNMNTVLARNTLLLGKSVDKRDDADMIGGFGSGYKMATLLCTKLGHRVSIQNGTELWTFELKHSKKLQDTVLTATIVSRKLSSWEQKHGARVSIDVENVTMEQFRGMLDRTLFLGVTKQEEDMIMAEMVACNADNFLEVKPTSWDDVKHRILFDERHRGRIYVRGLYHFPVPFKDGQEFGFDFARLEMNEARSAAKPWEFQWELGYLMQAAATADPSVRKRYVQMVRQGHEAAGFVHEGSKVLAEAMLEDLQGEHGQDVVPVADLHTAQKLKSLGVNAVSVPDRVFKVVKAVAPDPHALAQAKANEVARFVDWTELSDQRDADWMNSPRGRYQALHRILISLGQGQFPETDEKTCFQLRLAEFLGSHELVRFKIMRFDGLGDGVKHDVHVVVNKALMENEKQTPRLAGLMMEAIINSEFCQGKDRHLLMGRTFIALSMGDFLDKIPEPLTESELETQQQLLTAVYGKASEAAAG